MENFTMDQINTLIKECIDRNISVLYSKDNSENIPYLHIVMYKTDVDNLVWTNDAKIPFDSIYSNLHLSVLQTLYQDIEITIANRGMGDPLTCEHEIIDIQGKIRCRKCLAEIANNIGFIAHRN
jgi:hypothetical protein